MQHITGRDVLHTPRLRRVQRQPVEMADEQPGDGEGTTVTVGTTGDQVVGEGAEVIDAEVEKPGR